MTEFTYTLIQQTDDKETPPLKDLKNQLEKGTDAVKINTMKTILSAMLRGESLNDLLMHVIRFILPSPNKALKKLLVLYWEICQKYDSNGNPRPEMVLVCNALREDILHPNEFIRGQTLRLLCKLKDTGILEPLVPSVRKCLEHKHPYVRKNGILAIYSIFKKHPNLVPDAVELIQTCLQTESDQGARKNALIMLMDCSIDAAVTYYHNVAQSIPNFDSQLQLAFVRIIRKHCRAPDADKAKYIQTVISLLMVPNPTVRYEAAGTLVYISKHSSAIKAAADCYIELAFKESDNNVKLIVLDNIYNLHLNNDKMLDGSVMDILRIIASPDLTVRKRCLEIAMDLLSSRNVEEVIQFLKKELQKTQEKDFEKNAEYRQLLIQTIHKCAIAFPQVADSVVHVLLEFLADDGSLSATDVISFVKEVMERFPHLRNGIMGSLLESFGELRSASTLRGALWVIGEYCDSSDLIELAMDEISASVGKVPIMGGIESEEPGSPSKAVQSSNKRVLADGTYATETIYSAKSPSTATAASRTPIKTLLLAGEYYVCAVLASTLTKLALRYASVCSDDTLVNGFKTKCMLIMTGIILAGRSTAMSTQIDEDSYSRIVLCIRVLASNPPEKSMVQTFIKESRDAFHRMVTANEKRMKKDEIKKHKPVDGLIKFRLLKGKQKEGLEEDVQDISRATGAADDEDVYRSRLDKIFQLTGYSDSVYAEAYITVHHFDIILDILVINQTEETLQNLTVEFSALGDLKLVEKPQPHTIGPGGFHSLKVNFKVSSTESGIIFGNIVYDGKISSDFKCVVLNDIHIDIMDYIKPKHCEEGPFKKMWDEFEWENKILVKTDIKDLRQYLQFILKATNMKCLTRLDEQDCGFLAANLCAQSIFGEDALANICLEQAEPTNASATQIQGHIRIRSKTQGIALALGEKISKAQKTGKI